MTLGTLPLYTGIYSGTTKFDASGMENEHNDNGGHECWVKDGDKDVIEFIPATVGRAKNCYECGTVSERKARVTEGKKGVCRKPALSEFGDKNTCANCGGHLTASVIRKCGLEHIA